LTELPFYANTVYTKLLAAPATVTFAVFLCLFHGFAALRPKGSLKGIRLLVIAELSGTREGRASLEDVVRVRLFYCRTTKLLGGVL